MRSHAYLEYIFKLYIMEVFIAIESSHMNMHVKNGIGFLSLHVVHFRYHSKELP